MATDSAANSDSTLMNSQPARRPDFTISPRPSTMWVWGVMGYAQMTCGRHSPIASATAAEPSICLSMKQFLLAPLHLGMGFGGGSDVALGERRRKFLANGGNDRVEPDLAAQRCEAAEQRGIGHRAADVLHGNPGGVDGADALGPVQLD